MTLEELGSSVIDFIDGQDWDPIRFELLSREIFEFQFENNDPYRAFCQWHKISPLTLQSSDQIPAIPSSAFKDLDLSVLPSSLRTVTFHSSGTTEHRPSRHFHSPETLKVYEHSLLRWFKPHVMPDIDRAQFILLTPPPSAAPHSSLVHMFQSVSSAFGGGEASYFSRVALDGSWELDFNGILNATRAAVSRQLPIVLCGTAFSFIHLCDFLTARKITLNIPKNSRVFETGGYKGRSRSIPKADLHKLISQTMNVPESHIISEYGMSELSSQAYDRLAGSSDQRLFHFPPWVRATILSPETGKPVAEGETGLIRVLDLANLGSVMAIQTEDLALRRGDGFELLGRAEQAEPRGCSLMQVNS